MSDACVLHGVRVIDFGQYMAGPMAAMLLADQGADVIRIDPPGGPRWNTPANATWNRNKRSIVLDLKQEADRDIARKLVATADVVVENFRPGVMARLGVGVAEMTAQNPRLIYCSLPGFGADDPRSQVRAWEGVLGAATATYRSKPVYGGRPVYTVIPYSSAFGAFLCAVSVGMALNARERSGVGQHVEIPLYDATFTAIGERGVLVNGKREPEASFNWNRILPCKDGRWFQYNGSNKRFVTFLEKTGMKQWRDAGVSPKELGQRFDEIARTRTASEWEALCAEIGTEGVTIHTSAEWLVHKQALESAIIADFTDPELGKFRGPGINVRLSRTPGAVRAPRPVLNAHHDEIINEVSTRKPPAAQPGDTALRAALQGLRVLDLCIVLAGPTCGRTLAEFGADVIKIDSPHVKKVLRHNDINRAKRSILLDLKTPEGLEIFWRLIANADVLLQNFRTGIAEKLGIGYDAVRARRPDIIYGSMNTYGQQGPFRDRPGHEGLGQAVTGMTARLGSEKPAAGPFPGNDYGTGLMACYGVVLALLNRRRTGQGQFVDSSLAYSATMLQSALMQDYPGKKWDEPHGQEALGSGPLHRAYQAGDGWLFLGARQGDLKRCPELADLATMAGADLERALETRMPQRGVADWVQRLTASGIGAHRIVATVPELMQDDLVKARGLSVTRDHTEYGPITTTAPGIRMSRTPPLVGRPAPKPGSDAASVLTEIGMGAELDRLIRAHIIAVDGVAAGH